MKLMRAILRFLVICAALLLPATAMAQTEEGAAEPALLVADEVFVTQEKDLVAKGNVEAFQGNRRLKAEEIRYNRATGALTITGPIVLQDGEDITVLADAAELDTELKTGLLIGARMVIDERLELTAVQTQRVNERYSQLYRTVATSCRICETGRPPLWQIRATRVIHDKEERQLYFDNAQFRIRSVPVFYLPRLRMPDPTVERATGFLQPELVSSSVLGLGVRVPYFITLGDHRDITVSPYLSERTRTIDLRYRQAFYNGRIEFDGAISDDDVSENSPRGYLFGTGNFSLGRGFGLAFFMELSSDDSYLQDYNITTKDRLESRLTVSRARRDEFISGTLVNYNSLRNEEINSQLPSVVGDGVYRARYFPKAIGGEVDLKANAHVHRRESSEDILGRDVSRMNIEADYIRSWTRFGLRTTARIGGAADLFDITRDSTVPQTTTQLSPRAAVALRYPLSKQSADGVSQIIEPVMQLGWVGGERLQIPNEESTSVEFDTGNLISLSRFPAPDRRERGTSLAYGVSWSRFAPNGWDAALTFGQVLRDEADPDFSEFSGLSGTSSDFLIAGQIKTLTGLRFSARTLVDQNFSFTKAELRGSYNRNGLGIAGSYLWLTQDQGTILEPLPVSEIALLGSYAFSKHWYATAGWRYSLEDKTATEIRAAMSYTNECVTTRIGVERVVTTSSVLEPNTTFSVTIGLRGFSANSGTETYTRSCGT